MSTLKVNAISDAAGANGNAITLATDGTCTSKITNLPPGNRRLNINGAMIISQRGDSTGVTGNGYYACDRYYFAKNKGTYSITQDNDTPDGFGKSLKIACTTAEAISSDGYQAITYRMEGVDCSPFQAGTSSAKKITLSFWIKSNLTGQFQVNFENEDNAYSGSEDGINSRAVSISSAGTWEKKVITMDGDTAVPLNTGSTTKQFCFDIFLSAGTNYTSGGTLRQTWQALNNVDRGAACTGFALSASTSNYVNITGVQLEIGDVATDFEHRSYGDELQRCQRYYYRTANDGSTTNLLGLTTESSTKAAGGQPHPTRMRAVPTISFGSDVRFYSPATGTITFSLSQNRCGTSQLSAALTITGGTAGQSGSLFQNASSNGYIEVASEL